MSNTRRRFLATVAAAGATGVLASQGLPAQSRPSGRPPSGNPTDPDASPENSDVVPVKSPSKAMLEENEKDIKKNIEKLYQLATDLKAEVEKTDSSQVLSLALLKKADEIEKLAHDIKNRAKG